MNVRGFRNLLILTSEVERRVHDAGHVPPPKEFLMDMLAPHAKIAARAAKAARQAQAQAVKARALARECAVSALQAADDVAAAVIESTPAVSRQAAFDPAKCAKFDPAKHTVQLVAVPGLAGTRRVNAGDLS